MTQPELDELANLTAELRSELPRHWLSELRRVIQKESDRLAIAGNSVQKQPNEQTTRL